MLCIKKLKSSNWFSSLEIENPDYLGRLGFFSLLEDYKGGSHYADASLEELKAVAELGFRAFHCSWLGRDKSKRSELRGRYARELKSGYGTRFSVVALLATRSEALSAPETILLAFSRNE